MVRDGEVLQLADDRAAHARTRPPQHFIGDARIDDVRGDVLHQHDDEDHRIDDEPFDGIARPLPARKVDDVRRDDGQHPRRQIFQHEHQKAQAEPTLVLLQQTLVVQRTDAALFFARLFLPVLVEQMLEIGDNVVAAFVPLRFGGLRLVHILFAGGNARRILFCG